MAEHKGLAAALAAFQAEVPKMSKDETAKVKSDKANYSYGYASLDQFVEIVEPVLGKHGLSVTSAPIWMDGGRFVLLVTLLHESGEERTGYWPLPDPAGRGVGPQDIGSAMTYGRRYVGWGLTGTFPSDIDDDGQKAQQTARESWDNAQPVRPPANRPVSAPPADPAPKKTSWTDAEVFGYQAKMAAGPLDVAVKGYDWMATRDLHNRKVANPTDADAPHYTATETLALRLAHEAVKPDNFPADIEQMQEWATARGLMKIKVSETEELVEVLHEAHELAVHAVVEMAQRDTPEPQDA